MAYYIIKHCSFEYPVLSVFVRTTLVTNRTLCHFVLINIFAIAKINVYTCSIFNSPSIVILIVLDGCYGLLWPFYLLFLWVCCAWFKQYRQKCIFVRFPKKSHESLDFDLVFQEKERKKEKNSNQSSLLWVFSLYLNVHCTTSSIHSVSSSIHSVSCSYQELNRGCP